MKKKGYWQGFIDGQRAMAIAYAKAERLGKTRHGLPSGCGIITVGKVEIKNRHNKKKPDH